MALSLMIYNKGSKIFSYTKMFSRIISYLIRRNFIKRSHQNERPTSQNTKMALWPHDDDLQIFFFKISYNSWCYLTQVLTWHCNAISELWIGNDFKYFRYLSGWLITHSKHNFQCQCHQFATWTVLPTQSIWMPNKSFTGICQLLDKSNNFLNFIKSIKFFNFYGKTKIAFYSISLF